MRQCNKSHCWSSEAGFTETFHWFIKPVDVSQQHKKHDLFSHSGGKTHTQRSPDEDAAVWSKRIRILKRRAPVVTMNRTTTWKHKAPKQEDHQADQDLYLLLGHRDAHQQILNWGKLQNGQQILTPSTCSLPPVDFGQFWLEAAWDAESTLNWAAVWDAGIIQETMSTPPPAGVTEEDADMFEVKCEKLRRAAAT